MRLYCLRRALLRPRPHGGTPFPADSRHRRALSSAPAPKKPGAEAAPPPPPMPTRPWGEALAAAQRAFCVPLAGLVLGAAGTGNAAVAPPAVHASLALAAAGARGATRRQVVRALGCGGGGRGGAADAANVASRVVKRVLRDRSTSGGPRLAFAGGVWADASRNLSPEFVEVAGNVFGSAAKKADFQNEPDNASEQINSWVKDSTKGTVTTLLPAGTIDQNTGLVLGTALYFRGRWLDRSDVRRTTEQKFYCLDGTSVEVPFVEYDRTRLFAVHDNFKVIKLPYKQGKNERKFSMYIFLPDNHDGLFELTQKFFSEPMFLEQHLPTEKCHVGISVPNFTISFEIDVKDFLKDMRLELPFLRDAEFSDMIKQDDSGGPLFLSDVLHKAVLEVNEKGIEETSVSMGLGKPLPAEHFNANHPFFFMIREEVSGTVIFMGHVLDPSSRS
ncbi:probable non-inhibitory serpin-Z9 [Oryza brachyantha]|nr:probable non-inhibitory serpin-Z9 [Oryza brachyantha]